MGYNPQGSLREHNKYHGYTYVRGTPNCPLTVTSACFAWFIGLSPSNCISKGASSPNLTSWCLFTSHLEDHPI